MSIDVSLHFKEYRDNKQRIEEAVYQVKEIESNMYNVRAVSYGKLPSSNTTYTDSKPIMIKLKDDLMEKIEGLRKTGEELEKRHLEEIYKIDDDKLRRVLRLYYMDCMRVEDIADLMQCSVDHVYKLRRIADREFNKIINDIKCTTNDCAQCGNLILRNDLMISHDKS